MRHSEAHALPPGYTFLASIIVVLAAAFIIVLAQTSRPAYISSFDDCARAGYPILESYPAQCRTPDGRTFVQPLPSPPPFAPETACGTDADCLLINSEHGLGCCYAGACEPIDYSEEKWVAVNAQWFESQRAEHCPSKVECGPAPGCAVRAANTNFTGKCFGNACLKAPLN
jgi:hypothetical protein